MSDHVRGVDIAFVMDCSGNMQEHIASAKLTILDIVEGIKTLSKDIRFALVEHHGPHSQNGIAGSANIPVSFTSDIETFKFGVRNCSADSINGDGSGSLSYGLQLCLNLNWRKRSDKICVLVADSPPHVKCSDGNDSGKLANQMEQKGISIQPVGSRKTNSEANIMDYESQFGTILIGRMEKLMICTIDLDCEPHIPWNLFIR